MSDNKTGVAVQPLGANPIPAPSVPDGTTNSDQEKSAVAKAAERAAGTGEERKAGEHGASAETPAVPPSKPVVEETTTTTTKSNRPPAGDSHSHHETKRRG